MVEGKKEPGDLFKKAFSKAEAVEPLRWAYADKDLVYRLVDCVVACGGLVSFSTTQDSSSYVLTFLHDNIAKEDRKWYVGNASTINDNLRHWVDVWEALLVERMDAEARKKG